MAIHSMCRNIATLVQEKTQSRGYRPFGVSMLVAGYDDKGPHLFQIDPSGTYYAWKATAIGKGVKTSKSILERRFNPQM
jgi:20S proteasome subunit alpha 2